MLWKTAVRLCRDGSICVFSEVVQTSRPASGRARLAARVRASAAVLQNRPCRRNPPPMPVRAACLRQTAPDAGLRWYLIPAFLQDRKGGRPLVAPTRKERTYRKKTAYLGVLTSGLYVIAMRKFYPDFVGATSGRPPQNERFAHITDLFSCVTVRSLLCVKGGGAVPCEKPRRRDCFGAY